MYMFVQACFMCAYKYIYPLFHHLKSIYTPYFEKYR